MTIFPAFFMALLGALALTPVAKWIAPRVGAVAIPREDRWHRRTVPMLGGAAVWTSVAIVATAVGAVNRGLLAVVAVLATA